MKGYPTPKELAWIKDLSTYRNPETKRKVTWLYRYLLWSYRYNHTDPTSVEHRVCYAMIVKYHRKLYGLPYAYGEEALVKKHEAIFQEHKRERQGKRDQDQHQRGDQREVPPARRRQRQSR